ncbi:hypothetical protein MANI_012928 [Metarhizium anisopliae]
MRYTNAAESDTYFQSSLSAEVQKYRVFPATAISGKDRYAWEMIAQDEYAFSRKPWKFLSTLMRMSSSNTQIPKDILVFTSDYLQDVFGDAKPAANMEVLAAQFKGGGYVELNGEEGKWWTQSSRSIFGDDDPGHRLTAARTSFFIPGGEVDAMATHQP